MTDVTLTHPAEGVVLATLDRPERLNAITGHMFDDFEQLAHDLNRGADHVKGARVLILTGAGRGFCSGYDLDLAGDLTSLTATEMLNLQERAADALKAIHDIRIPVIAAVNGAAAGGGLSLALAADIRLASEHASFVASFSKIGLSAGDLGASWLLPRLVGPAHAADIALTGRTVRADEAARLRLVNRVVPADALIDEAIALAQAIARNSPAGVRLSKRALQANLEVPSYAAALELENRGQTLLTRTADMAEALAAFLEKRPATFTNE
ncbi:enoyl-CoA hydratase/isomerase family protein [Frondihabitans australicus]|uniref:Enoyl-CoA hydratase/carnithine racemase n=1 Tax=Frondihabitans australicus TaxID=386892 RepID=A0A495IF30_9MICO|nr:enoyl-CoA hydratase-related protein [Frondihabitans australicus]RKR74369.1 enoyl-CoA hydratase/carnithine racemase [Frondihabitans australicus]